MDLGAEHLAYVVSAYGVSAAVLAALALWLLTRDRGNARALREHETRRARGR